MATINLTPREVKVLNAIIGSAKIEIDWAETARLANVNTGKQAGTIWWGVKKKLLVGAPGDSADGDGGENAGKGKAGGTKRKKATDGDDEENLPKKGKKSTSRKVKKDEQADADDDGAEGDVKVKAEDDGDELV